MAGQPLGEAFFAQTHARIFEQVGKSADFALIAKELQWVLDQSAANGRCEFDLGRFRIGLCNSVRVQK